MGGCIIGNKGAERFCFCGMHNLILVRSKLQHPANSDSLAVPSLRPTSPLFLERGSQPAYERV